MKKTAGEIAQLLGGTVEGNPKEEVSSLNSFELAGPGDLTFAGSKKYFDKIDSTKASCILVGAEFTGSSKATLIKVPNAKEAFVMVLSAVHKVIRKKPGTHPSAVVDPSAFSEI